MKRKRLKFYRGLCSFAKYPVASTFCINTESARFHVTLYIFHTSTCFPNITLKSYHFRFRPKQILSTKAEF